MMSQNRKTKPSPAARPVIILTGGGSGGHITPILSLVPELRRLSPASRLIYVGLKHEQVSGLEDKLKSFDAVYRISAGKLRRFHGGGWRGWLNLRNLVLNLRDGFKLAAGYSQSRRLIKRLKPDIVFSKGGFVAVPVALAAKRAGVPIITHDSDAVPGLANRLIGRWAAWHATGMPTKLYSYPAATMRYTGIPIQDGITVVSEADQTAAKAKLGLPRGGQVLLIGGAGLGSQTLNDLAVKASPTLLRRWPGLYILHLCGDQHLDHTTTSYKSLLAADELQRVQLKGFSADFNTYSAAADLIVSRAGATSIAEFAAQAKACIFIPAPWLPGGQQISNAKWLASSDAAVILDNNVSLSQFEAEVGKLLSDKGRRQKLAKNLHSLAKPDAARTLSRLIIETTMTAGE